MPKVVGDRNLRTMEVTPDTGKDFRDTSVLSGTAEKTPAESETNSVAQYKTSGGNRKAPLGGEMSNS